MPRNRKAALPSFATALLAGLVLVCIAGQAGGQEPERAQQWRHGWVRDAVFYEIFVRSFSDSDGDGVGDLAGLSERLDYLNDGDPATDSDLGVTGIWLMPIFESPSYHGYNTVDYRKVNREYGTREELARFIRRAHSRGIRVIVDFMINHTGVGHPWFTQSASGPTSARRDWYVWRADNPGWQQPWGGGPTWHPKNDAWYYGIFWSGMPDLNFRNAQVRAEAKRLAFLWLRRGIDGFRLDAARHLIADGPGEGQSDTPETHEFWREFAAAVRQKSPDALLVGENWTDTATIADYYGSTEEISGGDELPMNFNFPLSEAIIRDIRGGRVDAIARTFAAMAEHYPAGVLDGTFLTNHDNRRLASQLGNDPGRLRLAAAILLTLPGTPFLYYGEEVGLRNGPGPGDEQKRTPMPWNAEEGGGFTSGQPWHAFAPAREQANVATQDADPGSLLNRYRRLIRLRNSSRALRRGTLTLLETAAASPVPGGSRSQTVLAFVRQAGNEHVLVAHNLSLLPASAVLPLDTVAAEPLFADTGASAGAAGDAAWRITLPPRGSGLWRLPTAD
jgi:glycosidase